MFYTNDAPPTSPYVTWGVAAGERLAAGAGNGGAVEKALHRTPCRSNFWPFSLFLFARRR